MWLVAITLDNTDADVSINTDGCIGQHWPRAWEKLPEESKLEMIKPDKFDPEARGKWEVGFYHICLSRIHTLTCHPKDDNCPFPKDFYNFRVKILDLEQKNFLEGRYLFL